MGCTPPLTDPDMMLVDEHTGVEDRLGQVLLSDLGLKLLLLEVLSLQAYMQSSFIFPHPTSQC